MPIGNSRHPSTLNSQPSTGTECLVIEYAPANAGEEPPKLYVPVSEAHLVSKYVGAGKAQSAAATRSAARAGTRPRSRPKKPCATSPPKCCASRPCAKRRPATRASRTRNGSANLKARLFTRKRRDQITAIADTKADQERAKPMDRLICGDVGFGKTEVAIRAAFKCVMDGKQVADARADDGAGAAAF